MKKLLLAESRNAGFKKTFNVLIMNGSSKSEFEPGENSKSLDNEGR